MGRSCKQEHEILSPQGGGGAGGPGSRYLRPIETVLAGGHEFMKLPPLESPSATTAALTSHVPGETAASSGGDDFHRGGNGITDWAMMDRLVASHLNGQTDAPMDHLCFDGNPGDDDGAADGLAFYSAAATRLLSGSSGSTGSDDDLWSFARSAATSTERLSHVSL
uniref:Uncharacterized protein n=1 Tax=Arundo donax TaxID=35708 RepID=A0A0A8Y6X5_ARUDO